MIIFSKTRRKINVFTATPSDITIIPETCAFCKNKPIGILKTQKKFFIDRRWICNDCRIKWAKGELDI